MKIENSVVLVTGANRGLGKALVLASLALGARRIYAGARDPKQLEPLVQRAPERVAPLELDITSRTSLERAAAGANDVSLLINNAGVLSSYDIVASSPEQILRDFEINVFGTLATTKAFLPALGRAAEREQAAVVNVLSVVSLANMPALGGYSAAKAAAYSATQALRHTLAKKRIRVHAALPGAIDTDMVRSFDMPKTRPELVAQGILEGVEQDLDEIMPDPMSRELVSIWRRDAKALERRLASMSG
jgi:NAD(P)-dependent dehydrogenase (short-subunit alcohol dehydrogenase family)